MVQCSAWQERGNRGTGQGRNGGRRRTDNIPGRRSQRSGGPGPHHHRPREAGADSEGPHGFEVFAVTPHQTQARIMGQKSAELQALLAEAEAIFDSGSVIAAQDFHLLEIQRRDLPTAADAPVVDAAELLWE